MINQDSLTKYHEQIPPQHNLAEEIILGGTLVNTNITELAMNELITESFSLETHQIIYRTIIDIYLHRTYVDSIILINTLWELNLLSKIGGIKKILNLLKHAQIFISQDITYLTAQYYIYIIKDKYLRRLLIQYGYNIITLAYLRSITPYNIFTKADKYIEEIKSQYNYNPKSIHNIGNDLSKLLIALKKDHETNKYKKLQSGFYALDKMNNGFEEGDLVVIAGRPSMGKTSLSLNIVLNLIAQNCRHICIFSLEMSREQILYKLLSISACIPIHQLQLGNINQLDWLSIQHAASQLVNSAIHIYDNANLSINSLNNTAKILKSEHLELKFIVIDYLQLIQTDNSQFANRAEELSTITRSLKILAKELDVTIIILSQLNRNVENRINKKPMLSDLKESGCLNIHELIIKCYKSTRSNPLIFYKECLSSNKQLLKTYEKYKLHPQIRQTTKQYRYKLLNNKYCSIAVTHNHQVLTIIGWRKADALKYKEKIVENTLKEQNMNFLIQNIDFQQQKYSMNDLSVSETQAFMCSNQYILHNSIEQDADLVLMLYRESYYHDSTDNDNNITNLIVAKHRNGPTGSIELQFNPLLSSFKNL
uniref:Replicative DNA helicase n=1 Tax=Trichogloeopsis pedicellata TaxID=1495610 RepID=A0A1G4P0R4_9FLOR|nr:Replication helicase subunit [Trichogloeopsis pedicellata]SCW24488.1 Replication helicase subunit [Trichogloeopsis pedicellata]